ncbi:hypothetical protein UlMin_021463 [Ulmus minor]
MLNHLPTHKCMMIKNVRHPSTMAFVPMSPIYYSNVSITHLTLQSYFYQTPLLLFALGMAITIVVTIAELLKNNGLATEKKVSTSTVGMKDENKGRMVQKAKIEIVLGKSEKFDSLMTAATAVAPEEANDEKTD